MPCMSRHTRSRAASFSRGVETCSGAAQVTSEHRRLSARAYVRPGAPLEKAAKASAFAHRKGEHGSAILETFLSMILLGLILFGALQLFQLVLANMITDYAAFRGARSASVGFKEEYAFREALIKAAPISGSIITPDPANYSGFRRNAVETEKSLLTSFMEGTNEMQYAYWIGAERIHTNYECPHYGERLLSRCKICGGQFDRDHYVRGGVTRAANDSIVFTLDFRNYPLNVPFNEWLTGRKTIDISGEVTLKDYSASFRE